MTNTTKRVEATNDKIYAEVNQCIQCGYCLPSCPTYTSMEIETASPRGRINLVKMAVEGKIDVLEDLKEPMDLCLGCRACEVACPVNVPYGSILEWAKERVHDLEVQQKQNNQLKDFTLNQLFTKRKAMKFSGDLYYLYQKSGIQKVVRSTKVSKKLFKNIGEFEEALPKVLSKKYRIERGKLYKARTEEPIKTVSLFLGCINDALFYHINYYTLELLRISGCDVYIPKEQTCCGALHSHQGQIKEARQLAKENLLAFEKYEVDEIVTNAGGCGALLEEYGHLFKDEGDEYWAAKAKEFTKKIKDIAEILITLDSLPITKTLNETITYQPSCHLSNVQNAGEYPEKLIRQIAGVRYIELPNKNSCCGSGGVYNIQHYDESMKILSGKMDEVNELQPDIIVTCNPGCLIQMTHGVNKFGGKKPEVLHLVELLARACEIDEQVSHHR
ncbi:Fe-s oxidoreductase [Bacillus sp. OxB-1]|uniref:(Fe-S)-binding protein n=1 Tax=Bacillus sp. (strain OxB-1) TaxID=98228 RepID=UPI000581C7D1|nr:(Fe-S)-binding protein [Bacillus sp. OxB-1]BAQ09344.1 Fe-s oxidoreductase [Bacillus sp. OxB-1]